MSCACGFTREQASGNLCGLPTDHPPMFYLIAYISSVVLIN
jgi:hypothetical protein